MQHLASHQWHDNAQDTLLCLHGFMGGGANWTQVAKGLGKHWRVVAIDLPGHGQSVGFEPHWFSIANTAQLVIDTLDALAIKRCALLGYSMGGRLAFYLALNFPERFSELIIESSSLGIADGDERAKRKQWDATIANKLETMPFADFLQDWYAMPLFDSLKRHPNFDTMLAQRLTNDPKQLALSMRGMGTGSQPSLWKPWLKNQIPTLLLAGGLDVKYVAISEQIATLNVATTAIIIPDVGHNIHFEAPDKFISHVKIFLSTSRRQQLL